MEVEEAFVSDIGYRVNKESAEFAFKSKFLCATCLSRNRELYNLDKPLRILMINLGIMMTGTQKVCWECVAMLKNILNFKQKAIEAQLLLMETGMDEINSIKSLSKLGKTKRVKVLSVTRKIKQKETILYDPETTVVISRSVPPPLRPLKSLKIIPVKNEDLYVQIECVNLETVETNPKQSEDFCVNITSSQQNKDTCVKIAPFESGETNLKQNKVLLAALTPLASVASNSKPDEGAGIEIVPPPLECTELNAEQNRNYFGNSVPQSIEYVEKKTGQDGETCVKFALPPTESTEFNAKQNENYSETSELQSTEYAETNPKQHKDACVKIALPPTECTKLNAEQNENYSETSELQSTEYVATISKQNKNECIEITLPPTECTELNAEQNENYLEHSEPQSTEYVETNSNQDKNECMEITLPRTESTEFNAEQNETYPVYSEPQSTEYAETYPKQDKDACLEIAFPPTESIQLNAEQNGNYSENSEPLCTEYVETNSKQDKNERMEIALPPRESTEFDAEQNETCPEYSEPQSTEYAETNPKLDKNACLEIALPPTESIELNAEQNGNYSENSEPQCTEYVETNSKQDERMKIALPPTESTEFDAELNENYSENSELQSTEYVETNLKQDNNARVEMALPPTKPTEFNAEQNKKYFENSEPQCTEYVKTSLNQDKNERIEFALPPTESTELNAVQNENYFENSELQSAEYVETNSKQDNNARVEIALPPSISTEFNAEQNQKYSENPEPQCTEYVETNSKQDERMEITLPPTESTELNAVQNENYFENSELQSAEYVETNSKQDDNARVEIALPPSISTEFNAEQNQKYSENPEPQCTEYVETNSKQDERMEITLPPTESTELNAVQNENYFENSELQSAEYVETNSKQDNNARVEIALPPSISTEFNAEQNQKYSENPEPQCTEYVETNSKQDERMEITLPPTESTELNAEQHENNSENTELQPTEYVETNSNQDKNVRMEIVFSPTESTELNAKQNENYSENSELQSTEYVETNSKQVNNARVEMALPPTKSTEFNAEQNEKYSENSEPLCTEHVETNSKQDKNERMEIALQPTESAELNAVQNENYSENSELQSTEYVEKNSKQDNNARVEIALPPTKSTEFNAEQNEKYSKNSEPQCTEYSETNSKQDKNAREETTLSPTKRTELNVEQNKNYSVSSGWQCTEYLEKQDKDACVEIPLPPSKSIESNYEQNENIFANMAPKSLQSTDTKLRPTNISYNEITSQFTESTKTNGVRNEDTCVQISQKLTEPYFEQNLDQGIITATQSFEYRKSNYKPNENVCDKVTTEHSVEENSNQNEDPCIHIATQSLECEKASTKQDEQDCVEIVKPLEPVEAIVKQNEDLCINISPLESGKPNCKQNICYYIIPASKSKKNKSKRNKKPPVKIPPAPVKYVIRPVPLQGMQSNFSQTEKVYGKTEYPRLKRIVLNDEQNVDNFFNISHASKSVKSKPTQDNNPCDTVVQHRPVRICPKPPSQSLLKFHPGNSDKLKKYRHRVQRLTSSGKPFVTKNAISTAVSNDVIPKPSLDYLDDSKISENGFASVNKFLTAIKTQEIQLIHVQTTPESVDNFHCLETNIIQIEDTMQNVSVVNLPQTLLMCNENMSSGRELPVYLIDGQIEDDNIRYQNVNSDSTNYFDNNTVVYTPLYFGNSDISTAELDHQATRVQKSINKDGGVRRKTADVVENTMAKAIENTTVYNNFNTTTIQEGQMLLANDKDSLGLDHSEIDEMEYDYPAALVDNNDNDDINKKHDITKEKQQLIVNRVTSGTSLISSSEEIQKTIVERIPVPSCPIYVNSEISSVRNTYQLPTVMVGHEAHTDVTKIPYTHTKVERSDEIVISKNLRNVWLDHPYCKPRNLFMSDDNIKAESLLNITSYARSKPCTGRVPRGVKRIHPKKANEDITGRIIKKVSDKLKETSHTHILETDIIPSEVDPTKKETVEVATVADTLEILNCDSLLVNVKVEKSDSVLATDRNIEGEYDWTVERYNLEQSGLIIKPNHINTDDSVMGSASEAVELDTPVLCDYNWTVNRYNLEENELNIKPEVISNDASVIDTASETSDTLELEQFHAPAFAKYQSDASSDSFQDYTYVPPESLNEDQEIHYSNLLSESDANVASEFNTNNITVSFSSLFDANSQVESTIENADVNESEINNVIGSEERNLSPGLLEPLYFTEWVDETYSHALNKEIDMPSKGIKRKAPSQWTAKKGVPKNSENSDAQIKNPVPKRMKRKEGSNPRRKRSRCINKNFDKLKYVSKKLKQNPATEIVESVVDRLNDEQLNIITENFDSQKDVDRNISDLHNGNIQEDNSNVQQSENENPSNEANNIKLEVITNNSSKEYSNEDLLEGINYDKLLLRPVVLLEDIMPSDQFNNDEDEFVECDELVESDDNVLKELQSLAKIITDKLTTNDEDTMEETIEEQIQGKDGITLKEEDLLQPLDFSVTRSCSELMEQLKKQPGETKKGSKGNRKEKVDNTNTSNVQSENTSTFTIRKLDDGELQDIRSKLLHEPQFKAARDKCHKCILTFDDLASKELHDEKCHEVSAGYYVCKICKCRFRNKTELEMHNTTHESCLQCRHCPKEYLHYTVLLSHIKNKHPEYYKSVFPNAHEMEKPDKPDIIRKEKKYKCRICEKEYAYPEALKKHVNMKHALRNASYTATDNNLSSNINNVSFNYDNKNLSLPDETLSLPSNSLISVDNLSSPRRKRSTTRKFKCTICANDYKYAHSLKYHLILKHGMEKTSHTANNLRLPDNTLRSPSHRDSKAIKHKCKICAYEYKYAHSLRSHMTKKHDMKKTSYTATDLNLSLPDSTLRLPSNGVSSVDNLSLPDNTLSLASDSLNSTDNLSLPSHNNIARTYKCKICVKEYEHIQSLQYHVTMKHGMKNTSNTATDINLSLPHDTLSLPSSADNLSLPTRRNKSSRKYKCRICSREFRRAHSLKFHVAVKHGTRNTSYNETDKNFSLPDNTLNLPSNGLSSTDNLSLPDKILSLPSNGLSSTDNLSLPDNTLSLPSNGISSTDNLSLPDNTLSLPSHNNRKEKKYKCRICSNEYKRAHYLEYHVSMKHGMKSTSYTATGKNLSLPDINLSLPSKGLSSTDNLSAPDNTLSLPSKHLSSTDGLSLMVENLSLKDDNSNAMNNVKITCTDCKTSFRSMDAFTKHSETMHV